MQSGLRTPGHSRGLCPLGMGVQVTLTVTWTQRKCSSSSMAAVSREAQELSTLSCPPPSTPPPHPPPLLRTPVLVMVTSSLLEDLVSLLLPFLISNFVSVLCHTSLWFAFLFSDLCYFSRAFVEHLLCALPRGCRSGEKTRQEMSVIGRRKHRHW